jgi:hypothetical protein
MVTLIYADRCAWLRGLLRMVSTHVYPDCYAAIRNQMVTHGYEWLRMGQFADVSTGLLWKPGAEFVGPLDGSNTEKA